MITDLWPLFGLRLSTPRLELRLPDLAELAALGRLAAAGVHHPDVQPFVAAWTDGPPEQVARNTLQFQWSAWGRWSPQEWTLQLVVLADGEVIGTQGVDARDFARLREVGTGSWLGRTFHGRGYGTEMRAAVLELAFEGSARSTPPRRRSRTTPPRTRCPASWATSTTASSGTSCGARRRWAGGCGWTGPAGPPPVGYRCRSPVSSRAGRCSDLRLNSARSRPMGTTWGRRTATPVSPWSTR
jgi:RimJ/RimL family protein N-acetyltransferase